MKNMKKYILAVSAFLPPLATAAEVPTSQILYVAPWPTHVDVQMSAAYVNTESCGQQDFYRVDLQSDPEASAKLATILLAFAQDRSIGLHISGCLGDRAKIVGVRLYK